MAYVDEATINAIRRKHPIKEVVERYVSLTKKGDDYWGLCPFHADTNASMSVSTRLDMFQCFSCKKAGNIFNFIAGMENISYGEAINLLASEDGFEVRGIKHDNPHTKDYEVINLALKYYQNNINSELGKNAINYLEGREINRETIKKFEIGLSISKQPVTPFLLNKYDINTLIDLGISNTDSKDIFNDRIMIPIHDLSGNPIGFGGRIYQTKDGSKYVNTKATRIFDKGNILYNYHRAHKKLARDDSIIIMEGYFDVIRASTVGVNNCVAPMGTSLTKYHANILKKVTNNVILCFDGDEAGRNATIHAIPILEGVGLNVKIITLEEKDPDEFIIKRGREAFLDKVNNPINVIDFKINYLGKEKNLNDTKEASVYLDEVIRELVKERDDILVELTLKKLSIKFNMEFSTLKDRYDKYKNEIKKIDEKDNFIVKKVEKFSNKYGQATNNLLYYMIISGEVIDYAEANVIMIMDDKKRRLYNEIIYYYHKYGSLILADFITYLTTKTDVVDTFYEIYSIDLKKAYTKLEIEDYIKCINEFYRKNIIDKLKLDLKQETDPMKQANILNEIMKIRGVKTSD